MIPRTFRTQNENKALQAASKNEGLAADCGFLSARIRPAAIMLLAVFVLVGLAQTSHAQKASGDAAFGIGMAYGFDIAESGQLGLNLNAHYALTGGLGLGLDFIYYLLNDPQYQSPRFFEVNINSTFYFVNGDLLRMYALAGVHYSSFRYDRPVTGQDTELSEDDFGFNIGAGIELDYDSVILYAEPKLSIGGFDQPSISIGGRFPIR